MKVTITEINIFLVRKTILSEQGFKGTVVNRTLSSLLGGSLEITLTVPLKTIFLLHNKEKIFREGEISDSRSFCSLSLYKKLDNISITMLLISEGII